MSSLLSCFDFFAPFVTRRNQKARLQEVTPETLSALPAVQLAPTFDVPNVTSSVSKYKVGTAQALLKKLSKQHTESPVTTGSPIFRWTGFKIYTKKPVMAVLKEIKFLPKLDDLNQPFAAATMNLAEKDDAAKRSLSALLENRRFAISSIGHHNNEHEFVSKLDAIGGEYDSDSGNQFNGHSSTFISTKSDKSSETTLNDGEDAMAEEDIRLEERSQDDGDRSDNELDQVSEVSDDDHAEAEEYDRKYMEWVRSLAAGSYGEKKEEKDPQDMDDRKNSKAIHSIDDGAFKKALLDSLNLKSGSNRCRVLDRVEGGYHHVAFLSIRNRRKLTEYIVKVPLTGTPSIWKAEDAYMMRCEARTIAYIGTNTNLPVPKVVGFNDSCENELGAPYIVMTKLLGVSAYETWFGKDISAYSSHAGSADSPSEATAKKRATFIQSLARTMAELDKVEFNMIGMPNFDQNEEEPVFEHSGWHFYDGAFHQIKAVKSSKEFFLDRLEHIVPYNVTLGQFEGETVAQLQLARIDYRGMRRVLEIIYTSPPFVSSYKTTMDEKETFVLRHNDLDLQNILTDEDGNITGIIDWDQCRTAPRCVGPCSVPRFLNQDWYPAYSVYQSPYLIWSVDSYRTMYSTAMVEAQPADANLSAKSHMYQAAVDALYAGGNAADLVKKVISSIPTMRFVDTDQICSLLGHGTPQLEDYLRREIPKVFAPDAL